jgi:hypothetical protein
MIYLVFERSEYQTIKVVINKRNKLHPLSL